MSTYPHKCFIRVSGFDDGSPRPANPPGQAEDHLEAYKRFIFATKEDAVKVRRDNQDGNPATIRMRMRRCRGDEGRA